MFMQGLYPESHGIVNNRFYDSVMKKNFSKTAEWDRKWWLAEPVSVISNYANNERNKNREFETYLKAS